MSKRYRGRLGSDSTPIPDEMLERYVSLGHQLAGEMAKEGFRVVTAVPGWTPAHIEEATMVALTRMEIAARDAFAARGGEPENLQWQAIWEAMETGYRETMAGLLKASGRRSGGTLQ